MLFASIDIGTNAVRLLFSNVYLRDEQIYAEKASIIRIPIRLGEDVFSINYISEEKIDLLLKTMRAFKLLMDVYRPLSYIACATAAMREASNSDEVVRRIKEEVGIDIKVISGKEEADIVTASNHVVLREPFKYKMYVDVGGGSTEISLLNHQGLIASKSFKIGTIRYLKNKIDEKEWAKMQDWLLEFKNDFGKIYLVGSGGNINKITKMYGNRDAFMIEKEELMKAYEQLSRLTLADRIEMLGLRPDRADVIVPAAIIFIKIMTWIRTEVVYVPKIGLADGLIYKGYYEYLKNQKS